MRKCTPTPRGAHGRGDDAGRAARKAAAWALHGAQVWTLGAADDGRVPLELLLKRLGAAGYLHVLCEGGGHLAGALQDAGLVDAYDFFTRRRCWATAGPSARWRAAARCWRTCGDGAVWM
jgi:hypothetical protein